MGFLDKAKAAANDLAAKADTAINQAGQSGGQLETDRYLRDLGIIAFREHRGEPVDEEARERALTALASFEEQGRLGPLNLSAAAPPAPGGMTPPPPGGSTPPPPGRSTPPPPPPPPPAS